MELIDVGPCVGAGFVGCRSFDGCSNVSCEVAAYTSCRAVVGGHVLTGRPARQLSHLPSEQTGFYVEFIGQFRRGYKFPTVRVEVVTEIVSNGRQRFRQLG
jgi:hypothetical protein